LSLFAAGLALFVLLIASYSGRNTWIALGSVALSMAALVGVLFLAASHDPGEMRTRLAWITNELSAVADQRTIDDLTAALERLSPALSCDAGQKPGCVRTANTEPPVAAPEPMQAAATAATTNWLEPKQDPEAAKQEPPTQELTKQELSKQVPKGSSSPIVWQLGDSDAQVSSGGSEGFSIGGANVSNQALEQVHAVLKPDGSLREVKLALHVEGTKFEATIPAGAQFSLASETPGEDDSDSAGAILTFRYVQAGQRKSSILYLTPAMVSRLANRG
jgi:hypothetical protein